MLMPSSDIAVIGGGPAGSVTAWLLARAHPQWRIVVIETEAQPRSRPCGEFLAPGGVAVLHRADAFTSMIAAGAHRISGLDLHGGGRRIGTDYRQTNSGALGVRREVFDRVLQSRLPNVGVDILRGTRLRNMVADGTTWDLELSDPSGSHHHRTRLLIGADGRQSLVRRRAGLDHPPAHQRYAVMCRAAGFPQHSRCEMHLGPLGQIGIAPITESMVNINLLLAHPASALLRRLPPRRLLRLALAVTPSLAERCRALRFGWVQGTPSLPQRSHARCGPRVALIGDAAGFSDPFTGDGMTFALQSAEMFAAQSTAIMLDDPEPALAGYAAAWNRGIGVRHRAGSCLRPILARRRLAEGVLHIVERWPWLQQRLLQRT